MPAELGYFTIAVADVQRAKTFYGALFGWTFDAGADARYAHVNNTALPFGLARGEPASCAHLHFRVASVTLSSERVRELGGSADAPQQSDSGIGAVCRDAGGTSFSLWEPAPGYEHRAALDWRGPAYRPPESLRT